MTGIGRGCVETRFALAGWAALLAGDRQRWTIEQQRSEGAWEPTCALGSKDGRNAAKQKGPYAPLSIISRISASIPRMRITRLRL